MLLLLLLLPPLVHRCWLPLSRQRQEWQHAVVVLVDTQRCQQVVQLALSHDTLRSGPEHRIFSPDYALGKAATLRTAQYLILNENWYDTAFASELNGPITRYPERLIKTKPAYVDFYRAALGNRHPHLELERAIDVQNFMPELLLHKKFYGTFQMFVGDIKIFRVVN